MADTHAIRIHQFDLGEEVGIQLHKFAHVLSARAMPKMTRVAVLKPEDIRAVVGMWVLMPIAGVGLTEANSVVRKFVTIPAGGFSSKFDGALRPICAIDTPTGVRWHLFEMVARPKVEDNGAEAVDSPSPVISDLSESSTGEALDGPNEKVS